jgi:hypothetical protein
MAKDAPFSKRQGYVRPKEIVYRDELSDELRQPIIDIIRRGASWEVSRETINRIFNPYGLDAIPKRDGPIITTSEEVHPDFTDIKRVLLACEWFRLYDLLEDIFDQMYFHDTELSSPDEEPQAHPFQEKLNEYFVHAGIGWQMAGGKIIARGDYAFERIVQTAETELKAEGRSTAGERIENAIRNLSLRPKPDFSGAISHATGAMECVLYDITGKGMTFGDYVKRCPDLFPGAMKTAFSSLWGYASEEGARHGKEGVEPPHEEAEFIVGLAAALATYLNRKHPRGSSK